ncbi:hypothetical protein Sjap_017904 [Stephania japonica]|uniref:Uncharacterized protein n=1 Tax=Stephania japonica TaxID=461633 RepID=A0AAP0I716_9MAGN
MQGGSIKRGMKFSLKIYFAKLKAYGLYVVFFIWNVFGSVLVGQTKCISVYVFSDNATVAMECTEEVFLAKIIHGDGAKVIKVGEVNATTVEDEDDIAKFKDYKPSQSGDSKEAKVPSILPHPPHLKRRIPSCRFNLSQKSQRLLMLLNQDHGFSQVLLRENWQTTTMLQSQLNSLQEASDGERISINDLVIKDADKKGLSKIVDEVKSFTQKAKENSLKPEDYELLIQAGFLCVLLGLDILDSQTELEVKKLCECTRIIVFVNTNVR